MNFVKFLHALPAFACGFPVRRQWGLAALNDSRNSILYSDMTSIHERYGCHGQCI